MESVYLFPPLPHSGKPWPRVLTSLRYREEACVMTRTWPLNAQALNNTDLISNHGSVTYELWTLGKLLNLSKLPFLKTLGVPLPTLVHSQLSCLSSNITSNKPFLTTDSKVYSLQPNPPSSYLSRQPTILYNNLKSPGLFIELLVYCFPHS